VVRPHSLAGLSPNHHLPKPLIILHSLAVGVEQLCARSDDAPSLDDLRPIFCVICGQAARNAEGILQLVGHGMYLQVGSSYGSSAFFAWSAATQ
jgi:hypothetical protein